MERLVPFMGLLKSYTKNADGEGESFRGRTVKQRRHILARRLFAGKKQMANRLFEEWKIGDDI